MARAMFAASLRVMMVAEMGGMAKRQIGFGIVTPGAEFRPLIVSHREFATPRTEQPDGDEQIVAENGSFGCPS